MAESLNLDYHFTNAFAEKDQSLPVFLRQRGVQGSLRVGNPGNAQVDKVKLVLRGYLINTINHGCQELCRPHKVQLEQNILKLVDVQDSVSSRYDPDNGGGERFDFDFQISKASYETGSDSEDEESVSSNFNSSLPCSLGVFGPWCAAAAGQACCQAESLVKYELQASVYKEDDIIVSITRQLRIYDCPDSHPPPVHLAHFPDDFTCSQEQRLKTMYRIGSPTLAISVAEPKAVEIRPEGEVSLAAFALHFTMSNCTSMPKKLDVRANSLLKALTFISARKMECQPTAKSARFNPLLAAVPKWGRSYHRKLRISHWTRSSKDGEWTANALLWLPISEGATPAPTFFTPYLARRYSLNLRLEVKGDGKGLFNLHVPIQIVYPEGAMNVPSYETAVSTPSSEEEEFDFGVVDELPIYVR